MPDKPVVLVVGKSHTIMDTALKFFSWAEANRAGYFTRTAWRRDHRRGIKANADPTEISINGDSYTVYDRQQTARMSERVWSRGYLLDLFVGFPDRCKITTAGSKAKIIELHEMDIYGSPRKAIERGFNYNACGTGVSLGWHRAESFHVYADETTQFFVIDLDLHAPTKESAVAHLSLLEKLEQTLPEFLARIRGTTYFYQYRTIPSGIQIWVILKKKTGTRYLHDRVRSYLLSLGPDLDQQLKDCGLPGLDQIEILPTETHTVSMAGAFGKEIFTNRILKPRNACCDVIGLARYLRKGSQPKSVLKRYRSLLESTCLEHPDGSTPRATATARRGYSDEKRGYLRDLFEKAKAGITTPDVLFQEYLAPLAQFLYFREFRADPNRSTKTAIALISWVQKKHNGFVSRIAKGQPDLIAEQIRSLVRRLDRKTGETLKDWYARIELMDKRYPHKYESLLTYMENDPGSPETFLLTNCKRQEKAQKSNATKKLRQLPKSILESLEKTTLQTPKTRHRLKRFAARFLPLLYPNETSISDKRINTLLGVKSRQAALPYKKELQRLGLILGNWSWRIVRGKRCSGYSLTDSAWEAFAEEAQPDP